jgi:two-component sensor histidine kinase
MDDDKARAVPAMAPEEGGGAAEELAYRLRQQELAAEFGHFALKTRELNDLLQEASRVCALGLHSELCKVMEFLPDEGQFVVRAGVGWNPGVVGQTRVGADVESPTGYAFQTGKPVISNHLEAETRFRTPALLREHGVRRAINVLVQSEKIRFGVLEVDSPMEGRFTAADLAFMQTFANLLGVAIERQYFEEALIASEAKLEQAVAYQAVLTLEISHRVKNSLAVVASLLGMQSRISSDATVQQALSDAQSRVKTIAQLHDRLWRAQEVTSVDLVEFMTELCEHLRSGAAPGQIITYEFDTVMLPTDQAVPLGLLVNELVTNALKYACGPHGGEVRVSIELIGPNSLRLAVRDNGQGLPADFELSAGKSLGMKLINSVSQQLGGAPEWRRGNPGTHFILDFSLQT